MIFEIPVYYKNSRPGKGLASTGAWCKTGEAVAVVTQNLPSDPQSASQSDCSKMDSIILVINHLTLLIII